MGHEKVAMPVFLRLLGGCSVSSRIVAQRQRRHSWTSSKRPMHSQLHFAIARILSCCSASRSAVVAVPLLQLQHSLLVASSSLCEGGSLMALEGLVAGVSIAAVHNYTSCFGNRCHHG